MLSLDATYAKNPALVRRLESLTGRKLLGEAIPIASGSGFAVTADGMIVSNRHVVSTGDLKKLRASIAAELAGGALDSSYASSFTVDERRLLAADLASMVNAGAYRLTVTIDGKRSSDVRVIAVAKEDEADLALLKVGLSGLKPLPVASADRMGTALVGTDVYSFGFPLGSAMDAVFDDLAVTMNRGSISALRKSLLGIQHTAAISPGNSGGPLVDSEGLVLGVNTASLDAGNSIFFAVGADQLLAFLARASVKPLGAAEASASLPKPTSATPSTPPSAMSLNTLGELEVSADVLVDAAKGAEVYLDGKLQGTVPVFLELTAPLSELFVTGASGDYRAKLRRLSSLSGASVLKVELRIPHVDLTFASDPPGAKVILDGAAVGTTPLTLRVEPGEHRATFELEGYRFDPQTVSVGATRAQESKAAGRPLRAVTIMGLDAAGEASFTFTGANESQTFKQGAPIALSEGSWVLAIDGMPEYYGVQIPVTVGDKGTSVDLTPFRRKTSISFYGLRAKSEVYLDGLRIDVPSDGVLPADSGSFRVFVWDPAYRPIETRVTVSFERDAWVRYPNQTSPRTKFLRSAFLAATMLPLSFYLSNLSDYWDNKDYTEEAVDKGAAYSSWSGLTGFIGIISVPVAFGNYLAWMSDLKKRDSALGGAK